jgi:hypothetical protein
VGRTLGANRLLARSACGKRHRGRPLNSVVRLHLSADHLIEEWTPWERLKYAGIFSAATNGIFLMAVAMFVPDLVRGYLTNLEWIGLVTTFVAFLMAPRLSRVIPAY